MRDPARRRPTDVRRAGRRRRDRRAPRPRTGSPTRGHRVLVVEKKRFPREKTCGDGLTPRAVRQLHDMGLADPLEEFQRFDGLRSIAHGSPSSSRWPEHPDFPSYGYVVRRRDLDEMVADQAVKAGATLWPAPRRSPARRGRPGHRARSCDGKDARRHRAGPGPLRRGRRRRELPLRPGARHRPRPHAIPLGMAIRGYFTSPFHDEPWIESHLDLRDRDGNHLPGLRLDLPGRRRHGERRRRPARRRSRGGRTSTPSHLMDAFCATAPDALGDLAGDVVRPAHRRDAARPAVRCCRRSGPPGSSSATPRAR